MARPPAPELAESLRKGVYVVVPAYNERTTLPEVVRTLRRDYPNVVVVDDGSSDSSYEVSRRAGASVLRHIVNRGQGAALQSGIEFSLLRGAQIIVTFDADGQHDARDIARLVQPIAAGEVDATLGSRFLEPGSNVPLARRLLLSGGILFTWLTSGVRLTDTHNGLRAFSREAAGALEIRMDRMAHASEFVEKLHRSGLHYREVPVRIRYTRYSLAKGQQASGALGIVRDYLMGRIAR
ncbi:MAG: family 2 glycosyl transferase [Deltaproteobacteria bacterium]|nr:family 2 glycosyl transferase [Deltaproteobacteria bacterium]